MHLVEETRHLRQLVMRLTIIFKKILYTTNHRLIGLNFSKLFGFTTFRIKTIKRMYKTRVEPLSFKKFLSHFLMIFFHKLLEVIKETQTKTSWSWAAVRRNGIQSRLHFFFGQFPNYFFISFSLISVETRWLIYGAYSYFDI